MSEATPERMLDDIGRLRGRTRRDRHAYWFPLVAFGALTLLSSAVYYLWGFLGVAWWWRSLGLLLAIAAGAVATHWWYRRHADRSGLRTAVAVPAWGWLVAGVALFLVTALGFTSLVQTIWPVYGSDAAGLLAIAFGLLALAIVERSILLWAVTAVFWVAAIMGTFANAPFVQIWANGLFSVVFRGANEEAVSVFVASLVLLAGGGLAYLVGRRRG